MFLIRQATSDDVSALSSLARRTWSEAFGASVSAHDRAVELERTRSERYFRETLGSKTILVAEEAGELVGYVQVGGVEIPEVDVQLGDQAVQRVYVDRHVQGRGLGRRLLIAALEHPRLAHASRIFLTVWERNSRARRFYESVGFRVVGATTFTIGAAHDAEDLVMCLDRASAPPGA